MNLSWCRRHWPANRAKKIIEDYIHEGVRVVSIDKNLFPNRCVRDSYEQPALRHLHERLLRQLRPDVIHVCHLISHTTALLDVARRMDIPVFATLTDFFGFCYNNQLESAEGALCEGPDPERANCIACFLKLAGSRPNAEFIAKLGGHRFCGLPSHANSPGSAAASESLSPSAPLLRTTSSCGPIFYAARWRSIARPSRRHSS